MYKLIDVAVVVIPMWMAFYYWFKQAADESANYADPAGVQSSDAARRIFPPEELGPLEVIEIEDALEEARRRR